MTTTCIPVSREQFLTALELVKSNSNIYQHPRDIENSRVNSYPVLDLHKALCVVTGAVKTEVLFELSHTHLSGEYPNVDFKGIKMVSVDLSRVNFNYGKWDGSVLDHCSMPDAPWAKFATQFAVAKANTTVAQPPITDYFTVQKPSIFSDQGRRLKRRFPEANDSLAQRGHTAAPVF